MNRRNILPEGTRDLILYDCKIKRILERKIDKVFEKWGYEEVITPTLEFYETFNYNNSQGLKEEDMYKFFDNKGRILVLRPDMTIPISRMVETKFKDSNMPIKVRYTSNVFRVHESLGGKRNEYTDCGIELIGIEDKKSDLEVLVLSLEALKNLGLKDFKLEIGNIGFFKEAIKTLNINNEDKEIIGKFIEDKNLKNLEEYLLKIDIKDEYKEFFNKLPWLFGDRQILEEAKKFAFNDDIRESLEYLEQLYYQLDELGFGANVSFDLGMIPGLNYYTGIIFRGYGEGIGNSILNGGRYDKLIKSSNNYLPSIGFSIDVDSIIETIKDDYVYDENNMYKVYYNSKSKIEAIKKSQELRKEGYIVDMFQDDKYHKVEIIKGWEK